MDDSGEHQLPWWNRLYDCGRHELGLRSSHRKMGKLKWISPVHLSEKSASVLNHQPSRTLFSDQERQRSWAYGTRAYVMGIEAERTFGQCKLDLDGNQFHSQTYTFQEYSAICKEIARDYLECYASQTNSCGFYMQTNQTNGHTVIRHTQILIYLATNFDSAELIINNHWNFNPLFCVSFAS